jgi:hypothetical protein
MACLRSKIALIAKNQSISGFSRALDPDGPAPTGQKSRSTPRLPLAVHILCVARPAARQPVRPIHAEVRAGSNTDAMAHQHGRLAACALRMTSQELGRGELVLAIVTAVAGRRPLAILHALAGAAHT